MDELLEFEHEALLNVLNQNSLTISSKGLLNDRLLFHLVRTYSNPCHLVFVIGTDEIEENSILFQIDEYLTQRSIIDDEFERPKKISYASYKTQERHDMYLAGGVIFITTRILIVDMLTNRVPMSAISGIIIANAHRVLKDYYISFILRLYRLSNKTGFITALSQNASSFFGTFGQLEKSMRKLFVSHLYLWPRFQATILNSLTSRKQPKVSEFRIEMTPVMKEIQFSFLDLISSSIKELIKMENVGYFFDSTNTDEERSLNTISVVANNFNKLIRLNLDSVWYNLSLKARRTIREIQLLKSLLFHLTELDSVTFYGEIKHQMDSYDPTIHTVDWLHRPAATTLYDLTAKRIFQQNSNGEKVFHVEINPKLEALIQHLKDIEQQIVNNKKDIHGDDKIVDIIIVVENSYSIRQIERFLDKGRDVVIEELKQKAELFANGKKIEIVSKVIKTKSNTENDDDNDDGDGIIEFEDQLTLTQLLCPIESHETSIVRRHQSYQIHYYEWSNDNNCGLGLKHLLQTLRPYYVIIYEAEMCVIRQIELYQALYGQPNEPEIEVSFFVFDGSVEEQRYLRRLQVEKKSFEKLIQEKSRLPSHKENEGTVGEHPDLIRGKPTLLHPDEYIERINTRLGGMVNNQKKLSSSSSNSCVLIDLREFRSALPSFIHKIGIDLIPVTLEIGDYIITPECCIERKSIPDLLKSLSDGRLYSQTQIMTRHYRKSLLLIEFPEDSFSFNSRIWGNAFLFSQISKESRPDPLVQLSILTIQFPLLRLIWSPSPNFTADIINELKNGKDEPNKDKDIIRLNLEQDQQLPMECITDRFDIETKEFLLCLPGITTQNVYCIMNEFKSIINLVEQSIEMLTEKMGSGHHAKLLYNALHSPITLGVDTQQSKQPKETKRFAYVRKRKN
ncbi:DNA repair endonuclease XPF mei-9 [Dermatophagoides farinae]|uniref:DNA repair endonuclease XPF mei-9 n=1 Tax=Dermatophagoides farinae TaxID=6954 RepID=UPI003F5F8082